MTTIIIPKALLEQALESLWQMTKKFNFERLHESRLSDSEVRVAAHDAMNAIRAELAKPPAPAWHDAPEVAELKAERDAAMKDAERYRYLRDMTPWTAISAFDKTRVAFRLASKLSEEAQDSGVDLDKAIDAAIAKAEGEKP